MKATHLSWVLLRIVMSGIRYLFCLAVGIAALPNEPLGCGYLIVSGVASKCRSEHLTSGF